MKILIEFEELESREDFEKALLMFKKLKYPVSYELEFNDLIKSVQLLSNYDELSKFMKLK